MNEDVFELVSTNNLNWLVKFHNHVKVLLARARKEIHVLDNEVTAAYWEDIYKRQFPSSLRSSVFLMMFGHIEEMFLLLSRSHGVSTNGGGSGLGRFKPLVKKALGGGLARSKAWRYIQDAGDIRNAILHAAGRASLMRDPNKIKRIAQSHAESYGLQNDRVLIKPKGLSLLATHAHGLLREVNGRLNTETENGVRNR